MSKDNIINSHSAFICIKSDIKDSRLRVVVYAAKHNIILQCILRSDIVNDDDMQAILLKNTHLSSKVLLLNVYNEKTLQENQEI